MGPVEERQAPHQVLAMQSTRTGSILRVVPWVIFLLLLLWWWWWLLCEEDLRWDALRSFGKHC